MLEAKYYRDYGHNYMILQCRQQESIRSYQYKILTSGKIEELLRCSVRYINGSTYYYYDISSRTTLDSLYRDKKMSYAQVKDVLCQIHRIYEKLAGYFMDEAGLVLLPKHIYYNFTDKRYIGLYYPDYQAGETGTYKLLMDFLLEHVDTEDRNLTEKIYRMCEMAEEDCFFTEDALRILEDGDEPIWEALQEPIRGNDLEPITDRIESFDTFESLGESEKGEKTSPKRNLFYSVFAVLSLLGIGGAIAVYSIYELTQREQIILYGCVAAMGVCLVLCLGGIFADRRRRVSPGKNVYMEADEGYDPQYSGELYQESRSKMCEQYSAVSNLPPLDHVINRDMNLEMTGYTPASARQAHDGVKSFRAAESVVLQGNDDYGNTVFFDESAIIEHKLYATDNKNKTHIELKQFPCTVGKMAGYVDYVLPDNSISRIHARFDRQGAKVMLTDMNSTNGTYKNGLRMQPQETVEIEPGDEVRFGNLNYCYR